MATYVFKGILELKLVLATNLPDGLPFWPNEDIAAEYGACFEKHGVGKIN